MLVLVPPVSALPVPYVLSVRLRSDSRCCVVTRALFLLSIYVCIDVIFVFVLF